MKFFLFLIIVNQSILIDCQLIHLRNITSKPVSIAHKTSKSYDLDRLYYIADNVQMVNGTTRRYRVQVIEKGVEKRENLRRTKTNLDKLKAQLGHKAIVKLTNPKDIAAFKPTSPKPLLLRQTTTPTPPAAQNSRVRWLREPQTTDECSHCSTRREPICAYDGKIHMTYASMCVMLCNRLENQGMFLIMYNTPTVYSTVLEYVYSGRCCDAPVCHQDGDDTTVCDDRGVLHGDSMLDREFAKTCFLIARFDRIFFYANTIARLICVAIQSHVRIATW